MIEELKTEVSTVEKKDDFWNSSSGDEDVDAVAAAVAESVKEDELGDEEKVEESDTTSEPTDKTEEAKETEKDDYAYKYKSHKEAEEAYRERQAAADKNEARIKELEGQQVGQEKIATMLTGLNDVLANVDDPDVQAAIQKVKEAAGYVTLDRKRVDHKAATEIEGKFQDQNERIAKLEAGITAQSAESEAAESKVQIAKLKEDYPFASTIQKDTEALLTQHKEGKLTDDQLLLKVAEIGYNARQAGDKERGKVKEREGSDAGGTPGKTSDADGKKLSDAELMSGALLDALNKQRSYI